MNDTRTAGTIALSSRDLAPTAENATHSLSVSAEGRVVPSLLQEFVPARMDRLVALVHCACSDWPKPTVDPQLFSKGKAAIWDHLLCCHDTQLTHTMYSGLSAHYRL